MILMSQFKFDFIQYIDNIFALIAFVILVGFYVFIFVYNKKGVDKQIKEMEKMFDADNKNIIRKIEQLKEQKSVLDLQSSIDIINLIIEKSSNDVIKSAKCIILSNKLGDKNEICEKIKDVIYRTIDNNIIILNKIYHNNIKLSHYLSEYDKDSLIIDITNKINTTIGTSKTNDITIYIENRFKQIGNYIQLKLTS